MSSAALLTTEVVPSTTINLESLADKIAIAIKAEKLESGDPVEENESENNGKILHILSQFDGLPEDELAKIRNDDTCLMRQYSAKYIQLARYGR